MQARIAFAKNVESSDVPDELLSSKACLALVMILSFGLAAFLCLFVSLFWVSDAFETFPSEEIVSDCVFDIWFIFLLVWPSTGPFNNSWDSTRGSILFWSKSGQSNPFSFLKAIVSKVLKINRKRIKEKARRKVC